ncbi:hypothetical protein QYF36_004203 [Acer negundo]|nr:hypothetical protein QYF36_004203 [Acer negundo]
MEELWTKFLNCKDIISSSWKETSRANEMSAIQEKLNKCDANLSTWSWQKFGGNSRRMDFLKKEFESQLNGKAIPNVLTVHNLDAKLNELLSFAPSSVSFQKVLDSVDNKVTDNMNRILLALFTNSDIKAALDDMHPSKASGRDDSLCWHFDKRGFYTVRSGYRVALNLKKGSGSSSLQRSPWWRFLWKCNVPNKCKIFFLKAFNGWIPTFATLIRRRVDVVDYCQVCSGASETISLTLWSCNSTVEVGHLLLGDEVLQQILVSDFPAIFLSFWRYVDSVLFNLFILGCWRLWTNRNNVVHDSIGWTTADMVAWIDNYANEFQLANELNHKEVLSHQPSCCSSMEMLEAQACLEGLQLANDIGISGVVIKSDAAGVIQLLSDQMVPHTEMGAIIYNSLALSASVNLLSFVAIRREANSVSYCIAQIALLLDGPVVWLQEMPSITTRLVREDSSSLVVSV